MCQILGDTSFSLLFCEHQLPNMRFFGVSVALRNFFPENCEIPLLTEMSKNDAEIERVQSLSNFPSINGIFVGFSESMQTICHLSCRISR